MRTDRFGLTKILWPIARETFFRDFWEKQPLTVSRHDPGYYHGLFSRRHLDSLIAFTRPKFFDNLKPGGAARVNVVRGWLPEEEPFSGYYPDLADVHRAYAHGKTLLITGMQQRWPALAILGRNLEADLGCRVHTNLYLTPPAAQGFDAHYDSHEVFVLQIDGDKHWRLYGAARDLPLPNDRGAVPRDRLGTPTQEVFLQAGDLLYLPRGHVHEAFTSDRASLHLTVGVNVSRWLDLLQQALADAAAQDVRFRQSLPLGLLCGDTCPPALKDKFRELLRLLADSADLERALGTMADSFLASLPALPADYFAGDPAEPIHRDTLLERAPGVLCRVVREGDKAILHAPGARIDGPLSIAPALHHIARTPRFTPGTLPGLTTDTQLALVRRLLREHLLTIVGAPADAVAEPPTAQRDGQ
jgi:hypothetical protein